MSKIMLVNVTHVEESRVATLEDGILCAYEIETINRTSLKGNIYNAVVESVHPSLEAAFVRIGSDMKGFLPIDEVNFHLLPARTDSRKLGKIGQHLHPGQKIMAQVVREPFAGKPPTISTYFSLPGRFLVLMPGVDSAGVSRKIEDAEQRDKLIKLVRDLNAPEGFGIIVRTAGMGQTKTELQRDLRYLLRLWESIQRSSGGTEFPGLVYREADLVIRTIRDHYTSDVGEVWIDSEETYNKALAFIGDVMPTKAKTLKLHTDDRPLFNKFNLEEQIERIYMRRVPLPSGGEIVIDGTEALTAVDVNSARSRRKGDAEENALTTNLEAAAEIARQLRLRDQGGLIVVDFIDLNQTRNKTKVEKAMRDAMKGDKAKYDITKLSKLGLMEIARQRMKGAKLAASYATCPTCAGHGLIKNVEAAALAALRKLQARRGRGDLAAIRMLLPPEVAVWILNNKRTDLARMEERQGIRVQVQPTETLLRHEVNFESVAREPGDPAAAAGPPSASAQPSAPRAAQEREPQGAPAERRDEERGGRGASGRGDANRGSAAKAPGRDDKVVPFPTPRRTEAPSKESDAGDAAGSDENAADAAEGNAAEETRPRKRRRRRRRGGRTAADGAEEGSAAEESPAKAAPRPPQERGDTREGARAHERERSSERARDARSPREPEPTGDDPPERVPQGVRADELMPAAVGSAQRREKKGGNAPAGRRRRPAAKSSRGRGGGRGRKA